ncbi:MAG: 3-oxoacyl-ACP reductase FabG [Bdellovibrionales bacterium]|nr:3-oxoacyl-ACP reductase FabG [Bdellovibrionales bacterium]
MINLQGKIAVVTGAAQGIGRAISQELAQWGARVALVDRDEKQLRTAAKEFAEQGWTSKVFSGDVTDAAFLEKLVAELLKDWNRIDILVNNAGIIRDNFLTKLTEEDWDQVLKVNLKGPFLVCRAVVPTLRAQQSGKIINIISRSWLGNIGQSNYSASKGGLVSLTRTLALELARDQIQVNGVAPGFIDTPMTRSMPEKARERLIKMQPTGKMGQPQDIAAAVAFLSSDRAQFISGQILHVDGGKSCGILSL